MEARVAQLETSVQYTRRGIDSLKDDVREFRGETKAELANIHSVMKVDFRLLFGSLIAVALGLAGMMAKGFRWFQYSSTLNIIRRLTKAVHRYDQLSSALERQAQLGRFSRSEELNYCKAMLVCCLCIASIFKPSFMGNLISMLIQRCDFCS